MFGKSKRPSKAAFAGGLVALLALTGCAGGMEKPATGPSAQAVHVRPSSSVSVPTGQPAKTLSPDALDAPAATSVSVAAAQKPADHGGGHEGHGGHGGHGGGTYVHTDAGRAAAVQEEPHDHHAHAEVYTCPMHPEVTSETAGKCPKCGMDLVKREIKRRKE